MRKAIGLFNLIVLLWSGFRFIGALVTGNVDAAGTALAWGVFLIVFGFTAYWVVGAWDKKAVAPSSAPLGPVTGAILFPAAGRQEGDTKFFELAGREILSGKLDPASWAMALVEGNGNDHLIKGSYVRLRVAQLGSEIVSD